jgi:phosphoribosylglycinamide formyltransferase-1
MAEKLRVGALISGGGTNLQAIIDACQQDTIDARMVFVGTDNPDAYGLERAAKSQIPTFVVDYRPIIRDYKTSPDAVSIPDDFDYEEMLAKQFIFPDDADPERVRAFLITRAVAEAALLKQMAAYPFDLLVLAGFMRNMTPYFIDRVNTAALPKIMNIHPAILPSFPGVDGYGDTFRYGCKVGGCTVHFIDYGEDSGPIIGQKTFPIYTEDSLDDIKKRGLELEWQLYPECIQLYAQNRLKIEKKTFVLDSGREYQRNVVEIMPQA